VLFLVTGCGSDKLDKPLPAATKRIRVAAPWADGARIPVRFTCDGAETAPDIRVTPAGGTRPHAIVMTDPDAPGGTFVHWTTWDDGVEGENSFGKKGYSGPCPPKGDDPHRYVITAYELERPLGLPAGADADSVVAAIRERVAATGSTTGRYGR
jgi:phosphatidylethanolamine-binding protein (PEBP) family uncharacterized protein